MLKILQPKATKPAQDNTAFINLLYQIMFGRDAEPIAQTTWSKFLEDGHSYKDLFEHLWKSAEFQQKVEQNPYLKRPPQPAANLATSTAVDELINDQYFKSLMEVLETDRIQLFDVPAVRSLIAQWRYRDLDAANKMVYHDGPQSDVIDHTAVYNELSLRSSVGLDRGSAVIFPLRSIGWVTEKIASLKVLVIGARTENELFALLAAGFLAENITMIDLISYSPFVEIGDMHNLRFADDTFDIVLLSHVLPYSSAPKKAAHELCRVAKHGGLVSYCDASAQFNPPNLAPKEIQVVAQAYASCQEVLDTFSPYDGSVVFRLEPRPPYTELCARVALVFEIDKSKAKRS